MARTEETAALKRTRRYFLLLISPIAWLKCFGLIFYRTRARTRAAAALQYTILFCVIILMTGSCYLFYAVTADSGQYSLYLSNVASNKTTMAEGRQQFNDLIWRSVLKTFFLGVVFGLIQACNFYLAAQWRQRLCDRFRELLLRSPNGCVLYETAQSDEDMPKVITNDVKQFTTSLCTVLFGSMFFVGSIAVIIAITIACVFLVSAAKGDASGILICFSAFAICVLLILPSTQLYNWNLLKQSKLQGRLRGYLQRIQTNAECIVLYGSQRVELKYIKRLMFQLRSSMLLGAISFALVNFPVQLLTALNGMCTYIMPTVVFFFIRNTQTPALAQSYLEVIPLYSFLITVLGQLLLIMEPALITVTMGDHLWTVLNRLERLTKEHEKRVVHENAHGLRQDNANRFALERLNISVADVVDGPLLQSNINLEAMRGECVIISGPSGCGKTSLFRICARLRPIDAKRIILPERRHLLFIPQRPYLPLGSLRFQALFLVEKQHHIDEDDVRRLFQAVNLSSLLERHSLDTVVDWTTVLSVGEQQRLSFIRLLAYFTLTANREQLIRDTLVLFDESTSAVDAQTEHQIYERLLQLQVWFVTISHRPSLVQLHTKSLPLYLNNTIPQQTGQSPRQQELFTSLSFEPNDENDAKELLETKDSQISNDGGNSDEMFVAIATHTSRWQYVVEIFKFIHLPYRADDRNLKLKTIIAWVCTLAVLGVSTCSNLISEDGAKQAIKSGIASYVVLMIATPALFSLTVGGGQTIATLYTRRQMAYLAHLLLDRSNDDTDNNVLYHTRQITAIPNLLSHDIAELNSQLFYFIFGHIYYAGVIGQIILAIVLAVLLGEQNGGSIGVGVIYAFVFGFFILTNLLSAFVNKWTRMDEVGFAEFVTGHKRVDLQAEQIALSGERARQLEEDELHRRLDSSVRYQMHSGLLYSIVIGVVRLSVVSTYLVNYGIPAAIFFHSWYDRGLADPSKASTFVTLSVYMYQLYSSWNYINYFADPLARIQSTGIRIVNCLERLRQVKEHHHRLAIDEREQKRREYLTHNRAEPSLTLEHVDIRIPQSLHVLIGDVNLALGATDNLIIAGPSGCGKSTLLRLLAGLIPNQSSPKKSTLRIPGRQNTIFLSQQLHLIKGTLREQLSYLREAHGLGLLLDDLRAQQLLNELGLGHLVGKYSMDNQQQNWSQLLSIGEQQRLMVVAALLVGTETIHLFVLDEITSGCDQQTEEIIYGYLQRSRIQFLSVSHRKEIEKYHSCKMTIDANRRTYALSHTDRHE